MTSLREWGARGSAALAAAVFLTLIASLFRIEPISPLILGGVLAIVPLAAIAPAHGTPGGRRPDTVRRLDRAAWNGSVSWPETLVVAFLCRLLRPPCRHATVARDSLDAPWVLSIVVVLASLAVFYLIESWRFGAAGNEVRPVAALHVWLLHLVDERGSHRRRHASARIARSLQSRGNDSHARRPDMPRGSVSWLSAAPRRPPRSICCGCGRVPPGSARPSASSASFSPNASTFTTGISTRRDRISSWPSSRPSVWRCGRADCPGSFRSLLIGCSVWKRAPRSRRCRLLALLLPAGARVWRHAQQ